MTSVNTLSVGLIGYDHAWSLLLDQIGVHWFSVDATGIEHSFDASLWIANRMLTADEQRSIDEYCSAGGAVLFTPSERSRVYTHASHFRRCGTIPPVRREEYSFSDMFDVNMTVYLFPGDRLIATERSGKGIFSYFGLDAEEYFADDSACRKSFFADRTLMPSEIVARRSKRAFRQIVQSHLEYLHHQRNLPFAQKWYSPDSQAPVFLHRIDTDKGSKEQIDEIHRLSRHFAVPTTWFVDVKSHEPWLGHFHTFEPEEIGVHCYDHVVHPDADENRKNFERARSLLRSVGCTPVGIAAPTGAWSSTIGSSIREMGFLYSSEFSYDYDNLPSSPVIHGVPSEVLQVPIHPVCIGSMKREHMSEDEMIRYFTDVIDHQRHLREPIALYHHPTHGGNEVFRAVFEHLRSHPVHPMRFDEFARWWKVRCSTRCSVRTEGERIVVTFSERAATVPVRVSLPDGREIFMTDDGVAEYRTFPQRPSNGELRRPDNFPKTRSFSVRHLIHNLYDWWIKTTE